MELTEPRAAGNYRSVSIMLEFNREHPNNQADATENQWYERIQCDGQNDRYSDQKDRKTPANPVKEVSQESSQSDEHWIISLGGRYPSYDFARALSWPIA
jgi:hypothetical protein